MQIRYRSGVFTDTEMHLTVPHFNCAPPRPAPPTSRCLCRSCIIHSTKSRGIVKRKMPLQSVSVLVMMHSWAVTTAHSTLKARGFGKLWRWLYRPSAVSAVEPCHSKVWGRKKKKKVSSVTSALQHELVILFPENTLDFSSLLLTALCLAPLRPSHLAWRGGTCLWGGRC